MAMTRLTTLGLGMMTTIIFSARLVAAATLPANVSLSDGTPSATVSANATIINTANQDDSGVILAQADQGMQGVQNMMQNMPGQPPNAVTAPQSPGNNGPIHISTEFTYANSYWFRYQNREPNRVNLENTTRITLSLQQYGSLYVQSFLDFAPGASKPYTNAFAQRAQTLGLSSYSGYAPENDITEVDATIGYHYDLMKLVGIDVGWTNYITPVNRISVPAPSVGPAQASIIGHGPSDMQEAFVKLTLKDQTILGQFVDLSNFGSLSLNPYIYVGFDYSRSYDSQAGQYYELGVSPIYTVPNAMGLVLNPFASISFINNEHYPAQNLISTYDGYLGATVGLNISFPLNSLLHIPAEYGTYTIGGFIDGVFADSGLAQPTDSSNKGVLTGVNIAMQY